MKHHIKDFYMVNPIRIDIAGAGGTGSHVVSGLVRLHLALLSLGHPFGLEVTVSDPDTVSAANVGRQLFYPAEVGHNKAICLVNRCNIGFNLDWNALPASYSNQNLRSSIVISCVDSRASRDSIYKIIQRTPPGYLIDCGNGEDYGQVLIGNGTEQLPWPYVTHPDLINMDIPEDNIPSCSLAEALASQHLYVNQWIATMALQLLWSLFRMGGLDFRGYYINLKTGRKTPINIDENQPRP